MENGVPSREGQIMDGTTIELTEKFLALASWCAMRGGIHKIGRVFSRRDSTPG